MGMDIRCVEERVLVPIMALVSVCDGERYCGARKVYRCVWEQTGAGVCQAPSPERGRRMTPKLTMTTTAFVRVLSAVGALSVPMAMPSMGASPDVPAVDSGIPSSIEGRSGADPDSHRCSGAARTTSVLSSRGMAGWPMR